MKWLYTKGNEFHEYWLNEVIKFCSVHMYIQWCTSVQSSSIWDGLRDSKRREIPVEWLAADGESLSSFEGRLNVFCWINLQNSLDFGW